MTPRKSRKRAKKNYLGKRVGGVFIVVITLLVVTVFGKYYYNKIANREKLATYLPANRTVAILEFNLNPDRQDAQELLRLSKQNQVINQYSEIIESLIPNREDFDGWYANRGGIAVMSTQNGQDFKPVLFLGKDNQDSAADWIKSLALKSKDDIIMDNQFYGQKLISYQSGQSVQILWTDNFLIFSEDREPLEAIAKTMAGDKVSLRTMPVYNQIASALPEQNLGFIYLNRSKLLQVLNKNQNFLAGRLSMFKLYFPFLNIFSDEGVAVQMDEDAKALTAKHISLFNPAKSNQEFTKEIDYFFSGDLENILPENITFYAGGSNLLDQKNRLQKYIQDKTGVNSLIFAGTLSQLQNELTGSTAGTNIEDSLFSALKENYLLYADTEEKGIPRWGIIVQSDKPENDVLKIKNIVKTLGPKLAEQYLAKPTPITLPDGTKGTELKADIPKPVSKKIQISGQKMEQLTFTPEFSVFLWADHDAKLLIVTNSQADMQEMLEKHDAPNSNTTDYAVDKPTEVYFIDLDKLSKAFPDLSMLKPLKYLKVARKLTPIGIVSNYQIGF